MEYNRKIFCYMMTMWFFYDKVMVKYIVLGKRCIHKPEMRKKQRRNEVNYENNN